MRLETERLVLRMPDADDVRAVQIAIQMTLDDLARWMPQALKGQTQAQTRAYIFTQMALFVQDQNLTFGLFGKESGACLGMIELGIRIPQLPSFELSYWTRSDVMGQGFMTEAGQAILSFAFGTLHARRVFARCEGGNLAAGKLAEKIGLKQEGILLNDALSVDQTTPVDTVIYGLTPRQWQGGA